MRNVLIYTTQSCPHCRKLKKFLRKNGIDYIEKDVTNNEEFLEEMIERTGKALVPVIDLEEDIIIGFDQEVKRELRERLRKRKRTAKIRVN